MANAIHRTTKELRLSVDLTELPGNPADWIVNPDLSAVEDLPIEDWIIDGDTVRPATETERLPHLKTARITAVDAKTDRLLDYGFVYGGQRFTLNRLTQTTWINLVMAKDFLSYPITAGSEDGPGIILSSPEEVTQFYGYGMSFGRAIIEGGALLKSQIRLANTITELDAIIDTRE